MYNGVESCRVELTKHRSKRLEKHAGGGQKQKMVVMPGYVSKHPYWEICVERELG